METKTKIKFRKPSRSELTNLFRRWFVPIDFDYHGHLSWLKVTSWLFGLMLGGLWWVTKEPLWGAVSVMAQLGAMIIDKEEGKK